MTSPLEVAMFNKLVHESPLEIIVFNKLAHERHLVITNVSERLQDKSTGDHHAY